MGRGERTAVVLDPDGDVGGAEGVADVGWSWFVDLDDLVGGGVVAGAGGYAEEVLVCHWVGCGESARERVMCLSSW